ncbi:MAG: glutaredoxin [Bacteriovorax sp.]|nr:glutaredoxin [Bacteriovorax sp.]
MRNILNETQVLAGAQLAIENNHKDLILELAQMINQYEWVIIGMKQNPVVKKARKHLEAKAISYQYAEYGSYFSQWQARLAIKLWTGWPTFPQVFHKGKLVGGAADLIKYLP